MAQKERPSGNGALFAAAVGAAVLIVLYFTYTFRDAPPYFALSAGENSNFTILFFFLEKVFYLIGAGAILFVCFSAGLFMLARLGVTGLSAVEEAVFATGLGLGALSLATLGLGLAGLLTTTVAVILLVLLGALGARRVSPFFRAVRTAPAAAWSVSGSGAACRGRGGSGAYLPVLVHPSARLRRPGVSPGGAGVVVRARERYATSSITSTATSPETPRCCTSSA